MTSNIRDDALRWSERRPSRDEFLLVEGAYGKAQAVAVAHA